MHRPTLVSATLLFLLMSGALALTHCSVNPATNISTYDAWRSETNELTLPPPVAGRERHLVMVLAHNDGAETTDFIVPFGVLRESDVADVVTAAPQPGVVPLFPALQVNVDYTLAEFDARYPQGPDVIIVPAFHAADDPQIIRWLREQSAQGAVIVGICDGIWTLAHAGLLDDHMATGHWFSLNRLARQFPSTQWVNDRRYVMDGNIITTTGVSASIPVSLALVAAMGGQEVATETASRLQIAPVDDRHDSTQFSLTAGLLATALGNRAAFWRHDNLSMPLPDGVDEIALALAADAWSRTWRSRVLTYTPHESATHAVQSARGLQIVADHSGAAPPRAVPLALQAPLSLQQILQQIGERYGADTARFVAVQLEYNMSEP